MSISAVREQYGFYNRYEVVLRHEKSDGFIRDYVANDWDIAQRAVGIINDNVMVFSDWEGHLDEEWYDVMNSYEAYHFTTAPKALSLSQTWRWAEKSVFPTMKLFLLQILIWEKDTVIQFLEELHNFLESRDMSIFGIGSM